MNTLLNVPSNQIEYAFFDMDGTLVETDYANYLAYSKAINSVLKIKNAIEFDPNLRFDKKSLKQQFHSLSDFQYKRIIQLKNELTSEFLSKTFVNYEVVDAFKTMSETKTIVLVTNANYQRAIQTLTFHGLDKYVDVMLCAEDREEASNKYSHALEVLNVPAEHIQVFENEDREIANAIESGVLMRNVFKV